MLVRFSERVGGSSGITHGMTLEWQSSACCDHCTLLLPPPYSRTHCGQVRQLTTRRINLLTPTAQNEIKSNQPRYIGPRLVLLYHDRPIC